MQQICLVARNNCHVALEVTSYHDWKTSLCYDRCIFNLPTCKVLWHAAPFYAAFVRYIIKHLFVALEVTSYHDWKTSLCYDRCIFNLPTCKVLWHAAPFYAAFVRYIIKHLFHENLLHFEHKNDVKVIIKLTELFAAAPNSIQKFYNDCDVILRLNCNRA